jgi:hypothetical protein
LVLVLVWVWMWLVMLWSIVAEPDASGMTTKDKGGDAATVCYLPVRPQGLHKKEVRRHSRGRRGGGWRPVPPPSLACGPPTLRTLRRASGFGVRAWFAHRLAPPCERALVGLLRRWDARWQVA